MTGYCGLCGKDLFPGEPHLWYPGGRTEDGKTLVRAKVCTVCAEAIAAQVPRLQRQREGGGDGA